jgi:hypothetical protein
MPTLNDRVFDNGLTVLDTEVNVLHICGTLPTTYTEATSTYSLGNKSSPTVSAPSDRTGGGRKVTVSAITDGAVTATGTAAFYALCDTSGSRMLAQGSLSASQAVTSGNTFTLGAFDIGIPDPA